MVGFVAFREGKIDVRAACVEATGGADVPRSERNDSFQDFSKDV